MKMIKEKVNELRERFYKPKIKEIRRNPYDIENPKNLFASKTKEIERNLFELEESLFKPRKYYDYHDIIYKGIRDVEIYLICQLIKIIINQQEPIVLLIAIIWNMKVKDIKTKFYQL